MPKGTKRRTARGAARELAGLLATLPPGRRRVAIALIADDSGPTYPAVAAKLGLHLGTVHRHLLRIRRRNPKVYVAVMNARSRQLAERHREARARAEAHSKQWHAMTRGRYLYDLYLWSGVLPRPAQPQPYSTGVNSIPFFLGDRRVGHRTDS